MKIIQLIQKPQLRGAEIFACQLSNHLMDQGHEVVVVSIFKGDSQLPFKGETIHLNRPLSKRFVDFQGWKKFNSIIKEFNPDIIQANAADTLKFSANSKLFFGWQIPIIFRNANKMGDFIDNSVKLRLNKFYLSKVSEVISVSNECRNDFISTFTWPSNRIETIEIGVENKSIGEMPEDLSEIFNKGKVLLNIGSFVPEKNQSELLDVFFNIKKESPDLQLILIGLGPKIEEIKNKANKLGIIESVHFLGYRTDVLEILHYSNIFVLPSLIEGLPAVILESMYCDTPVVAYNVGGISEVVISSKTGWLVEKGDTVEFQNSIKGIIEDGGKAQAIVKNANDLIRQKFMNVMIAQRFSNFYKRIINQ